MQTAHRKQKQRPPTLLSNLACNILIMNEPGSCTKFSLLWIVPFSVFATTLDKT